MRLHHCLAAALLIVGYACTGARGQDPGSAQAKKSEDEKPLAELHALILDLDRNQKAVEKAAENYTYHVHFVKETVDGSGNVKKTETTDSESLTLQGVRVDREVARDGKPLTDTEAKKESERIDKEVAKAKDRRAKAEAKERETDSQGDAVITASRFLELGKFSNERRVFLDGRPSIVVDYSGDPEAKTRNSSENAVRDLVGTIWIDEADRTMVRAEGHFLDDYKIGGGLVADIRRGTKFSFRSAKVHGEAWLPTQIDAEGHLRMLLFVSFTGRVHVTTSDYRKFKTTSSFAGTNGIIGADGQIAPETPVPASPATPSTAPEHPKP